MDEELIYTTKGNLPLSQLVHKEVIEDYDDAVITAQEYYLDDELVRRDVNVRLKGKELFMAQASF